MIPRPKEIDTSTPNLWPFPPRDPPMLSARFHWRQAHGICVSYHPNRDHKLEWRATMGLVHVFADSADEAETAICEKANLKHWRSAS